MENNKRFLIPVIFSIVGVVLTFLITQELARGIAANGPPYDLVRFVAGTVQTDVRFLLYIFLPIYFVVFLILTIPIALSVIVFNKVSRAATYELVIFSTGEGFSTIKLIRRAIVPSLFALSFSEIFLNLIPDWIFYSPSLEGTTADSFLPIYDPLQTIIGALIAMIVGVIIFAPTWILNDSGVVTQVKSSHMTTRRCPDTEGIGRWFSNLFGGFAILAYPITVFYRFFYVRYVLHSAELAWPGLMISLFWIVGIPFLVMSFVMPFVILNEFGLSWTIPKIQGFARKLGAKDVKPKSLMLEMLEVQDHLNDQVEDHEIDPDSTRLMRK
ncbi:MAG: hypothetical protein E4H14_15520 [Candidatus Thorarchaeota archaeon]|nr:MAG: hypothetical protein E4H14_15520 [Candidatus Thorarchaeota archaeon]